MIRTESFWYFFQVNPESKWTALYDWTTELIVQVSTEQNEYVSNADGCLFPAGYNWIYDGNNSLNSRYHLQGTTDTWRTLGRRRNLISYLFSVLLQNIILQSRENPKYWLTKVTEKGGTRHSEARTTKKFNDGFRRRQARRI